MTKQEYDRIINRQRRLPDVIERAEAKLVSLYEEAHLNGMTALLNNPARLNWQWDKEVMLAKDANTEARKAAA